jgi:ADP-ribosylglycohydrolase
VGDALGAPFEFGPAGAFSHRFPAGSTENEMVGGGVWGPGEFTDDTQMAILEARSITERSGVDEADLFDRFRQWFGSNPKDVGVMTRQVLGDSDGWPEAPRRYLRNHPDSAAGNGGIMRSSFSAARWALAGNYTGTAVVGRRLSSVTHADPAAQEGRALLHMLCQDACLTGDPFNRIDRRLDFLKVGQRDRYRAIFADGPSTAEGLEAVAADVAALPNGSVWGCLRDAVRSLRGADSFGEALRRACDVGSDVDTVAAVTGALAGATFGVDAIPSRWLESLHGTVGGQRYDAAELSGLLDRLLAVEFPVERWPDGDRSWLPDR